VREEGGGRRKEKEGGEKGVWGEGAGGLRKRGRE